MGSMRNQITINKVGNRYESSDGKYTIVHREVTRYVNVGNYSQIRKKKLWEVDIKGSIRSEYFKTLKEASAWITNGGK